LDLKLGFINYKLLVVIKIGEIMVNDIKPLAFFITFLVVVVFAFVVIGETANRAEEMDLGNATDTITILTDNGTSTTLLGNTIVLSAKSYNQTWLEFDGKDDWVNLTDSRFNTLDKFSISVRFKTVDATVNQRIASKYVTATDRIGLTIAGEKLYLTFANQTATLDVVSLSNSILDNTWYDLVLVSNGSYVASYLDGLRLNNYQSPFYNASIPLGSDFLLGVRSDALGYDLNGSISYFNIYNKTITPSEIVSLTTNGITYIPVLFGHTIFNESFFREQLDYINDSGFESITDVDYYNWTLGKFTMPKKPIMFTFDDGNISVINNISLIMQEYNYFGVLGITTDWANTSGYLSWENISMLVTDYNWTVASHSATHCDFVGTAYAEQCHSQAEMDGNLSLSKQLIIDNVGITPITFVHPANSWNVTSMSRCTLNYVLCFGSGYDDFNAKYITNSSDFDNNGLVRVGFDQNSDIIYLNNFLNFSNPSDSKQIILGLNENQGTTAHDVSGNSNDGTITGATWNNDGINVTLTSGIDYILLGNTFTIASINYAWREIRTEYTYWKYGSSSGATILHLIELFIGISLIALAWLYIRRRIE